MLARFVDRLTADYTSIYISGLGADPIQLGLVNSFSSVAGTIISAPLGWLQDRYSLRKIFLAGVGMSFLVTLMFALANDWVMIIPAMILSSLAVNVGSCLTICDVSLNNADRSACKGICDGVFYLPSLLAPILAALIITNFGGISVQGIRPLYWISVVAGIVLLLFLLIYLQEIGRQNPPSGSGFFEGYREVFRKGSALKRWIAFSVVSSFSAGMIGPFTQLFVYEIKGGNQFIIGGMTTAALVIQVLFAASLGSFAGRVGRKKVYYITEPLYCASLLLLAFALHLITSSSHRSWEDSG